MDGSLGFLLVRWILRLMFAASDNIDPQLSNHYQGSWRVVTGALVGGGLGLLACIFSILAAIGSMNPAGPIVSGILSIPIGIGLGLVIGAFVEANDVAARIERRRERKERNRRRERSKDRAEQRERELLREERRRRFQILDEDE